MNQDIILGKHDKEFSYFSKWPIYVVDTVDKKGIYNILQNKLKCFEDNKITEIISEDDIMNYFLNYPEIDFECIYFKDMMPKHYIFKINEVLYSYTIGLKSKRKLYMRCYFDYNKIISID